ncbi:MAG: hypothetical protein CMB37_02865 [Euryarchaeota archaeon]|nr:hypothetical protein [Euryarchaeota archaeon]|tara:strand:- start:798 stop:1511 length:714 start_codon:yes stop_codon:yes gene_type:complete
MADSGSLTSSSDEPILSLENLTIGYGEPLVEDVNLVVKPGDIVSIVGPSGIGKTTLIRTIANLIQPISGTIRCSVPRRGGLGYIPQKLGLVRHASVYHNVDLGARAGTPFLSEPKSWLKRRNERVSDAIDKMGIFDKIREPVRRLSGGQQRRVATARTLAQRPKLILADEFLSELDEENISLVINSVKKYIDENDAAIILIEHDIKRAKEISNRMLVIDDGRLNPFVQDKVVQEVKI